MTVAVGILRLPGRDPALPLPAYATEGAAGMDLCASLAPGDRAGGLVIPPGGRAFVPSGIALEIPEGYEIQLRPRSGLALREGLTLLNAPGRSTATTAARWGSSSSTTAPRPVTIAHGMRIAQLVLAPVVRIAWAESGTLAESVRGAGGFGSTGTAAPARRAASLAPEELERYARHIVLREVGGPGQQRLRAARVLVVGAGGLGSPALLYLAAAGVGTLGIVDDDAVSLSNLQRQVLHATPEIGARKVDSAARALARLNPHVAVETHAARLDAALAAGSCRATTSSSTAATTSPPAISSTPPASPPAARSSPPRWAGGRASSASTTRPAAARATPASSPSRLPTTSSRPAPRPGSSAPSPGSWAR